MKQALLPLLLPLLRPLVLALFGGAASAEKADTAKPMNVESDALRYDDLKQTSAFTGNVVIPKRTITIQGAQVDVSQDPEGATPAERIAAPGKLAHYRTKRAGRDEVLAGERGRHGGERSPLVPPRWR